MSTRLQCVFHAERVIPPRFHGSFVLYQDRAGVEPMCKEAFDARLDNADDDPDLEPVAFYFLLDRRPL
jgi:hypothetical protein